MSVIRRMLLTTQPGGLILIRLAIGSVLLLEAVRSLNLLKNAGPSRLAGMFELSAGAMQGMGVVLLAAGIMMVAGLGTRLAAAVAVSIGVLASMTAYRSLGTEAAAAALADFVAAGSVGLVSLHLLVHGAGVWSVDATISLPRST